MMTHRALVHEYLSAITALDLQVGDLPVHALPLYHSAQMHVFLLPYLAVGAVNVISTRRTLTRSSTWSRLTARTACSPRPPCGSACPTGPTSRPAT